ncbi:MAG: DnaB-like helicase C-terminal domain-containing protein [Polaromonas sp.]|uniref:DnaB-like helicase C-terminal domain-containing protein n=1 Tax=Polaromonas sp. TaxID=1869339 RepID=UPI002734A5C1|nr:DnaB-like helicase C-terminal domain-containing protein [Polaromonas sp.]MDP3798205.1 DnaB-like helicase C-terminal domain-containing protein [Polaromonas sp.]
MTIEHRHIHELVHQVLDQVTEQAETFDVSKEGESPFVSGLNTGFFDLDQVTNGLKPGELILVAARPGVGRTSFVLNIAEHLLLHEEVPVMLFSFRTSAVEVAHRIMSSSGRIRYSHLVTGGLNDEEWPRLTTVIERLLRETVTLEINDDVNLSFEGLLENALDFEKRNGNKGVIIIDGLLGIDGIERMSSADRWTRIDQNARALKGLARKLELPILITSDAKSGDEKFERSRNRRPTKHDLYGSATLADIADTILLIYRDELFNEACREPGVAEIIVDKSMLATATIKLSFIENQFRFENLASNARYL